jgi:DNA-binding beta-propeller fold protein YncE
MKEIGVKRVQKTDAFAINYHFCRRVSGGVFIALVLAIFSAAPAQATSVLGTTALLEGPTAGSDSVVLAVDPPAAWTATANDTWLHLSVANQSGTGSTNVVFSCDANPGATRAGTLTIAGHTLTVTQAAPGYAPAPLTPTALVSSGLHYPVGVVADGAGNVYIADTINNALKQWTPASNTVTALVASGLSSPSGMAVDGAGNVYVADPGNNAIKEWVAASNTLNTLVASGLSSPSGVAIDGAGNLYITETGGSAVKKWTATNSTVSVLTISGYDGGPAAVDLVGNVYFINNNFVNNTALQKWTAANGTVLTLAVSGPIYSPIGMAVDVSGNVYVDDRDAMMIKKWTAASNTLSTLVQFSLNAMYGGVAVDGAGNIYFPYFSGIDYAILELPHAFVDVTPKSETADAGSDVLSQVLPATANLLSPFAPTSDRSWLTITGTTNGVVSFAFTATISNRTAHINLLGQNISINQGPVCSLSPTALSEGPTAGSDSVALTVVPETGLWTATANANWLHLSATNQSGTGSTTVVFSYDANPGAARVGTLTIGGQTLTVTQQAAPAYLIPTALLEGPTAGSDSVLLTVTPETTTWTASANDSWLHLSVTNQSGTGSTTIVFSYDSNPGDTRVGTLTIAGQTLTVTQQGPPYVLGTIAPLEGPAAGTDSVVLAISPESDTWTATANEAWLHLSAANQSGTGSTNVVFSYDSNPGATRVGTLTVAGKTLTVTQAGPTYDAVPPSLTTLVSTGLSMPYGVAVDSAGNVYIADSYHSAIKKWTAASNTVTTLVSSGLSSPRGVAMDSVGNVYIADASLNAIRKWTAASNTVTTLVSSGLSAPQGVAVDGGGNVYIADTSHNLIKKWTKTNSTVTTLVSSGLTQPRALAVDVAGNVYIADTYNNTIKKWTAANSNVTTLVSSGLYYPSGIAVDGAGSVYIADTYHSMIKKWTAASSTVTTLVSSGVSYPWGVAVDGAGNVYIVDNYSNSVKELPHAFVDATTKFEGPAAGSDVLPVVLPATANLLPPFSPTNDQAWLTINGVTNGVLSFSFSASAATNRTAHLTLLGQSVPIVQQGSNFLGATALLEGPAAGADSVVLRVIPETSPWTAKANASWLHLSAANQSGTGSTNVVFSFDANPDVTRTGTLTIAGWTLTITQAGSSYIAAPQPLTTLASGLNHPNSVAMDGAGNVYIADTANNAIKKWTMTSNAVTTLVASGLNGPAGVAVDGAGNVYIADRGNNAIKKWIAANNVVATLVASELNAPSGVAVDGVGNVYVADTGNNAVRKWTTSSNTVTTLVVSGLNGPVGVAVDGAGNVYIADTGNNTIKKWTAANNSVTTLIDSALNGPQGVAVDGSGNVYIADSGNNTIKKWTATDNTVTTLAASGLNGAAGVAVDGARNIYIADTGNNAVKELVYAFVNPMPRYEGADAGSDVPMVLPLTANLLAPFTPTSDQSWLTVNISTNGTVSFTFTTNVGDVRIAHVTLLGQTILFVQSGLSYALGTSSILDGATAGTDSVVVAVSPSIVSWTATANAGWLHLSTASQSGTGSTNLVFSYDANPGTTRTGTLTIAGQTLAVAQAGSTYLAAPAPVTTLVSTGLNQPLSLAVDGAGNVYIADRGNNAIKEWVVASNTVTTLVASGLSSPFGVAVDGEGNVYIADTGNNAIKKWVAASNSVIMLVASGLSSPFELAVDGAGNVYIADTGGIKKWSALNNTVTTQVSIFQPAGVAVDAAGNVYIADDYSAIKKWTAAKNMLTTLVSGLNAPAGVAVDGAGNVYIADTFNGAIKKWTAANNTVTTLVFTGLNRPESVAVDSSGNVYIADSNNNAVKELPRAFVDPTGKLEAPAAGNDVLPVVLPATVNLLPPFSPTSDQPWLAITGFTDGVVSFTFGATVSNRSANITLLGQTISVTQAAPPILVDARMLTNGMFQFAFAYGDSNASFTVLTSTNLSLPLANWIVLGVATNTAPGLFQFATPAATNDRQRFYRVALP